MSTTAWENQIVRECEKLIRRFENHARQISEEQKRRARRTTGPVTKLVVKRPSYWALADGFDPFLVRARSARIAHSIQRKIGSRIYSPFSPFSHKIPKVGGGQRQISIFQIADSAVSTLVFQRLSRKNRALMSSRAYAYRDDISVHDAIQYIGSEVRSQSRVFVAEYDFSKYFDNISHDYLWKILKDQQFLLTSAEEAVIRSFLRSAPLAGESYIPNGVSVRERGIPQGTSISLFLANVAAWELDRSLERLGVSFVRYADDTLIWSSDYSQLCRAADTLHDVAYRIGAPLNFLKSKGICLLVPQNAPAEILRIPAVEYLGHEVNLQAISIKKSVVERIKTRINNLIYFNLVREPEAGTQDLRRLQRVDRDYVTFIWQLRRYMYGDVSERRLRRFQVHGAPHMRFRGVMSFFPLIDDVEQLTALDHWLVCVATAALRKRERLLRSQGVGLLPDPHGLAGSDLARFVRKSQTTGGHLDLRLPSFRRIAVVIRRAAKKYGTSLVARSLHYDYD